MTFPKSPESGSDLAAGACIEPGCARSAIPSTDRCGIHLAETLRSDGEDIPFEDPDLGGMYAAATVLARGLAEEVPDEFLRHLPRTELAVSVLLDADSTWQLAQFGLDLLGTMLADEFGAMQLAPPTASGSNVLLRLRVLVPEIREIVPRLRSATAAMVTQTVGTDALAGIEVTQAQGSDGSGA